MIFYSPFKERLRERAEEEQKYAELRKAADERRHQEEVRVRNSRI